MFDSGNLKTRAIGIFIVTCIALIAISLAVVGKELVNLTQSGTIISAIAIFLVLYLLHGQRRIKREIAELKFMTTVPSDLEGGLIRRIEELSRKIHTANRDMREKAPAGDGKLNAAVLKIERELAVLSIQVEDLTTEKKPQDSPASTVIPLRNARETAVPAGRNGIGEGGHSGNRMDTADTPPENHDHESSRTLISPGAHGAEDLMQHAEVRSIGERLRLAVERDELELHLQPVVSLNDREPAFYESSLRLKNGDGQYVDPERLKKSAKREGVAVVMDGQLLFSAVRILRTLNELNKRTGLFCPLSSSTLDDGEAFEETSTFLAANVTLAGSLMLEIDQSAVANLNSERRDRLSQLIDLGYTLLLNRVENFDIDGKALHAAGFRYLKVSVDALLQIADDGNIDDYVSDFSEEMENCGITVIVSEIEQEAQVIHLIDFDLPLGQGSLFAPSRPVKPELLKPSDENSFMSG